MFHLSIRDLLWLTLVVAMGLGWFVHQRQLNAELRNARRDNADATFIYEMQIKGLEQTIRQLDAKTTP